jgi:hypothetical protein
LARLLDRDGTFNRRDEHGWPAIGRFQLELLKWWQTAEERLATEKEIEEYKRQVQISPLSVFVPDLFERIFNSDYIPDDDPENHGGDGEVFFPTSDEDFEAMMEEWSDVGPLDLSGVFKTPDVDER